MAWGQQGQIALRMEPLSAHRAKLDLLSTTPKQSAYVRVLTFHAQVTMRTYEHNAI